MEWALLTGVLMVSSWNSPTPALGNLSTTAQFPSPSTPPPLVYWCRAHLIFCGSTSTCQQYPNELTSNICKMPAYGRHWQGAEALGLSVRGALRDTRAQRGHPVQMTFQALTTLAIPHNWSTLPRRRHPTHPQQRTVLKVITGHHPPSRTSSHQFTWHVTPRTPPASPTCPPPRRAVPAQRMQDSQRKGDRLPAHLRLIKSPNAPRRK